MSSNARFSDGGGAGAELLGGGSTVGDGSAAAGRVGAGAGAAVADDGSKRVVPLKDHRNIGIMAHIDAGKTTTIEHILFSTEKNTKTGEVHKGAATMDRKEQKQERGITVTSAATTCSWKDHKINFIDTPGQVDFSLDVERVLRVMDGSVCLFNSGAGVEPHFETMWRQADKYDMPRICFANNMDRPGADFFRTVAAIKTNLRATPAVLQLPIGAEDTFSGVVDLVTMKAITWNGEEPGAIVDIPDDLKDQAQEYRERLVEQAVEQDEAAMDAYLEGTEPDDATLKSLIRKGTISRAFVPVTCGSAVKNKGVQQMLDAVIEYLPSPLDLPDMNGFGIADPQKPMTLPPSDDAPFSGLAFRSITDSMVGSLTFLRVFSGTLASGAYVLNATKGKKERIGRLLEMHANSREDIKTARTGDIVAVAGLKDTLSGDALCDVEKPIVLERMGPDPFIKIAIEPKSKGDRDKMSTGLIKLSQEDPSFHFFRNEETNQTVIEGIGELHLESLVDRLKGEFKVEANVGAPKVKYREIISRPYDCKYTHKAQSGGQAQFAEVAIKFEPAEPGTGFAFHDAIKGGVVPKEYVPGVMKGLEDMMGAGVLAGLLNVLFVSSPEVLTPEDHSGVVMGDLSARRGILSAFEDKPGGMKVVDAEVPLAEMFHYASDLRGMTDGRAQYSMQLVRSATVPQQIQDEIVTKAGGVTV